MTDGNRKVAWSLIFQMTLIGLLGFSLGAKVLALLGGTKINGIAVFGGSAEMLIVLLLLIGRTQALAFYAALCFASCVSMAAVLGVGERCGCFGTLEASRHARAAYGALVGLVACAGVWSESLATRFWGSSSQRPRIRR